jgi:signal transduction histidine kinase/DNA-binding response OmpR family regulator
MDKSGCLWIGTVGNGLLRYDPKKKCFSVDRRILEYEVLTIFSIFPDGDELWLGTDNGLICYDRVQDVYLQYDEQDGLQGCVFYPLSCMKTKDGRLFFGGTNGFTVINPLNTRRNDYKPSVIISDFHVNNRPELQLFNRMKDHIRLDHTQQNFSFRFASDNYLMPQKSKFRYRLLHYDKDWTVTDGSRRVAQYAKVPPGVYYFEVEAANNDGLWSDRTTRIKVIRTPSPWLSWPAYLGYILAGCFILSLIAYYYIRTRKLKLQLLIDRLDQQQQEEMHQFQLRFFTNISHDFRTPISLISATLGNLRKEGIKEYYYRIMNNNVQRLLNLVNELMDFRKVENGKMKLSLQKEDVNSFLLGIAEDFRDYAQEHQIELSLSLDPLLSQELLVDRSIVEKVTLNLLNNAFKYTRSPGKVTLETYADARRFLPAYAASFEAGSEERTPSFLIVVRDTGVGISEESISKVFERFYKVEENQDDPHLGTGIGLALVKSLVLLHKGSITIYSQRDKGTDMAVRLPMEMATATADQLQIEKLSGETMPTEEFLPIERKRLLIVEDNTDLSQLMASFFSSDYEVELAENGATAMEKLAGRPVDLILSDIMMPVMDGVELCRRVKEEIDTSHIPFLLLTAKADIESKMLGLNTGADFYFEKPIDFNLLLRYIRNIFARQQRIREYYAKNYFVDSAELSANEQDHLFLKRLIEIIDTNLKESNIDVNFIAAELSMSRSKLYAKLKMLTGKSIVEFILNYRLRKAARMIIEQDMTIGQVMEEVGLRSQSYFTSAFKKEFGDTPSAFALRNKPAR